MTERAGRNRLLGRMRVEHRLGADTAQAAFGVLSKRASQLMLEGWRLNVDFSNDTVVVVEMDDTRRVVEVTDCWDVACLAARPPEGLPDTATAN